MSSMAFAPKRAFELKGELSALSVLRLQDTDMGRIARELAAKVKIAPGFFSNTPIVIDLKGLDDGERLLDFTALKIVLIKHGLVPIGVRNARINAREAAAQAGFALLRNNPAEHSPAANTDGSRIQRRQWNSEAPPPRKSLMITRPVRSGQQVYARECDLIVLAQASPGSELLADGNIHVYGSLRGRALAGIRGDITARIFCQSLEAELIAIAGNYKLIDDTEDSLKGHPAQVYLREDHLMISPL
ncbi:septum site-determining protein MinC [Nitrosococcus oceani ATCC 19707]|uniref:Probable septum site-determining protein MinC n=2 Tax=Nitrosococcus oceani TaxID=1229 RepID=Q3JDR5_NITOC|nr:septum site-determining protein MinC [Nitrosococcus oceani]ABA57031.1 septum site-determining protein MinC [Nitrosococcus oceani ATCC 19707]EDZ65896.1 septum site-determining protein MinC [Nitrosococcus oceani AFC27]KFI20501.1 semialdehyde dehydrogenase [Nitrosococcus oceani C-27]